MLPTRSIPTLHSLAAKAFFGVDAELNPSNPNFYSAFAETNQGTNQQNLAFKYLLNNMTSKERAILPFFDGACDEYTNLIMSDIYEVLTSEKMDGKGKAFVNLIRSSQNENLPKNVKASLEHMVQSLNDKRYFIGLSLNRLNLSGLDLSNLDLSKAKMHCTNLCMTNLTGTNLRDAKLTQTDLQGAILINTLLTYANLNEANLSHANLYGATLHHTYLIQANLTHANLNKANLSAAQLMSATLCFANLTDANLVHANLYNANKDNAIFNQTNNQDELEEHHRGKFKEKCIIS